MQNKANSVWSRAGDRRAGHAAPDLRIVQALWKSQVIRAGERLTVRSAARFGADWPNSTSSGQAVVRRRWDHPRDVAATRVRQKPEVGWSLPSPWSPDPPGLCDRGRRGEKSVEHLLLPTKRPYSAGETLVFYQYRWINRKVMGASWLFRPLPLRERVGRGVAPVSSTLRTRRLVVPRPPHPNPLPQGEREPEAPSTKGVIAGSTGLRHGGGGGVGRQQSGQRHRNSGQ